MLAIVASVTFLAICNDRSPHCHTWQQSGECDSNAAFMALTCPVSCGTCEGGDGCADNHKECVAWMQQGECEKSPAVMLKACPVSCGICSPVCEDTHGGFGMGPDANVTVCEIWAGQGDCVKNPDVVLRHCPVACGVCTPMPADRHRECAGWAADGHCASNAGMMLRSCPRACGLLHEQQQHATVDAGSDDRSLNTTGARALCEDAQPEACAAWAKNGQCESNPDFMLRRCGKSCNLCDHNLCDDNDASCPAWRASGECKANPAAMLSACPRSCGVCQTLSAAAKSEQGRGKEEL